MRISPRHLTVYPSPYSCMVRWDYYLTWQQQCICAWPSLCSVCVFSSHLFWISSSLDVPAGVAQEESHTRFLIHLPSVVHAFIFLARRIQPFLSLVDREVEFCVLNDLIVFLTHQVFRQRLLIQTNISYVSQQGVPVLKCDHIINVAANVMVSAQQKARRKTAVSVFVLSALFHFYPRLVLAHSCCWCCAAAPWCWWWW